MGLTLPLLFLSLIVAIFVVIFYSWHDIDGKLWGHLFEYSIPLLWFNTFALIIGVGCGSLILGISLAWLVTMCQFRGRKMFAVGLILPMALPPFILAFAVSGSFDYGGIVNHTFVLFGQSRVGSLHGISAAIPVFSLALYPYVYLLTSAALTRQGTTSLDTAYTLGYSPIRAFFTLYLPVMRPAICIGLSLVIMEVLADFGAAHIFNIDTPTVLIYKTWTGFFSLHTALQLSSILLLFIGSLVILGRNMNDRYIVRTSAVDSWRLQLSRKKSAMATLYCSLILTCAFILPVVQLILWAFEAQWSYSSSLKPAFNSIILAVIVVVVLVGLAGLTTYYLRNHKTLREIMGLGYTLPGVIIALSIISILSWFNGIGSWLISNTILALIIGYSARFFRIAYSPIDHGVATIHPSMRESAVLLGVSRFHRLYKLYIPHLTPFLLTAALMVFVEVIKEMPATLILRPFGWDNLATKVFEYTSEARWDMAAIPALIIVFISMIGAMVLYKYNQRSLTHIA